jgi:putative protease
VKSDDIKNLLKVFNRGGSFSGGYFNSYSGGHMMSTETPKNTGFFVGKVVSYDPKAKKCRVKFVEKITPGDGVEIITKKLPHTGTNLNKGAEPGKELVFEVDGNVSPGDLVYRTFDKQLADSLKKSYTTDIRKLEINASVKAKIGSPLCLSLSHKGIEVREEAGLVTEALNNPISETQLIGRLSKTGGTPFTFNFIESEVDSGIYINISEINALKRKTIELFEKKFVNSFCREYLGSTPVFSGRVPYNPVNAKKINVSVPSKRGFDASLDTKADNIYLSIYTANEDLEYFCNQALQHNKNLFIDLPLITRDMTFLKSFIGKASGFDNIKGYVIKNYGQLEILKGSGLELILGSSFNVMNSLSYSFLKGYASIVALSTELNLDEINKMQCPGAEITVYGKLMLMALCQCPIGNFAGKKGDGKYCSERGTKNSYSLRDRKELIFDIRPDCHECFAGIFNADKILMTDKLSGLLKAKPEYIKLDFFEETGAEIKSIIAAYSSFVDDDVFKFTLSGNNITHAHFYRGVL